MAKRLGFYGHFTKLQFDKVKFGATAAKKAEVLNRNAAREWLRAVYIKVPVWTGMARGGLKYAKGRSGASAGQTLSAYLRVAIPIGPERTWDGRELERRPDKTPEKGGAQSQYTLTEANGKYGFSFSTEIVHFIVNDIYPGLPPSYSRPWQAIQAGNDAYSDFVKNNIHEVFPKLSDYILKTRVEVK